MAGGFDESRLAAYARADSRAAVARTRTRFLRRDCRALERARASCAGRKKFLGRAGGRPGASFGTDRRRGYPHRGRSPARAIDAADVSHGKSGTPREGQRIRALARAYGTLSPPSL